MKIGPLRWSSLRNIKKKKKKENEQSLKRPWQWCNQLRLPIDIHIMWVPEGRKKGRKSIGKNSGTKLLISDEKHRSTQQVDQQTQKSLPRHIIIKPAKAKYKEILKEQEGTHHIQDILKKVQQLILISSHGGQKAVRWQIQNNEVCVN